MVAETIDYQKVLADLKRKQKGLEFAIQGIEQWLGRNGADTSPPPFSRKPASAPRLETPTELASDTFFRKSVPDAIKLCLNIYKRPCSAKEITEGLQRGGFTTRAKNLYSTVYPTLARMKTNEQVVQVGDGKWGLTEWYPAKKSNNGGKEEQQPKSEDTDGD